MINYLLRLNFRFKRSAFFLFLLFVSFSSATYSQNSCMGSMNITSAIGNYGAGTLIGNGTPGNIQICLTANSLVAAGMSCGNAQFVISNLDGSQIQVIWTEATSVGTCVTVTATNGYAYIALNCEATGSTAAITWNTMSGGTSACIATCTDGIQNQGETGIDCGGPCLPCSCTNGIQDAGETGIDCGGPCGPCGTCFDGIQNGSETGVDCGGTCIPCTTNSASPDGGSSNCCSTSAAVNVYPSNCDQIGTSAYNLNSPEVTINSSTVSAGCLPTSPSGCGAYGTEGTWTQYNLEPGVSYLQLAPVSVQGFGTGNSITYHAYFQGPDCANLTYVDCQPAIQFSAGGYFFFESSVSGLDPNQNVWVYTWNNSNKYFDYTVQAVGAAPATNTACPGSTAIGDACNLGAQGATFNTPGSQGVLCSGGNWGSNENTTFYSFTANATTGSLEIQNIICNDGTNGNAQFAVWTSCAAIGTYGAGFLGCAVGTASISLSPLVPGQTYYIAADGFAGDNCTWSFTGTGIILPVEMAEFRAQSIDGEVYLDWTTASEVNNDFFTVQRTVDGTSFENIGMVDGAGNSQDRLSYNFVDYNPFKGTSYYRIKQTDFNGNYKYSELVAVDLDGKAVQLLKTINLMGQEVNLEYHGMVIDVYSDGSSQKRYQ